jgi:hypothetical protein
MGRPGICGSQRSLEEKAPAMTKPIPDKAEVALEYPDKLYIGTFERTARFDAHLDESGISLALERAGAVDERKSVHMHFHYALFGEILRDLARTVSALPAGDVLHREELREGAKALYSALNVGKRKSKSGNDSRTLTAEEEVALLHIME